MLIMYRILYLGYAGNRRAIVNPASAARWFARRSCFPANTTASLSPRRLISPPSWAPPGEWRRRRPGKIASASVLPPTPPALRAGSLGRAVLLLKPPLASHLGG